MIVRRRPGSGVPLRLPVTARRGGGGLSDARAASVGPHLPLFAGAEGTAVGGLLGGASAVPPLRLLAGRDGPSLDELAVMPRRGPGGDGPFAALRDAASGLSGNPSDTALLMLLTLPWAPGGGSGVFLGAARAPSAHPLAGRTLGRFVAPARPGAATTLATVPRRVLGSGAPVGLPAAWSARPLRILILLPVLPAPEGPMLAVVGRVDVVTLPRPGPVAPAGVRAAWPTAVGVGRRWCVAASPAGFFVPAVLLCWLVRS
ncbi:hypothetical protein ACIHFC_11370 [Streptomyces sp. NPDC052013]|uniref:hypothetical protein n=1 Tax=Streptomyces sp. NPDC052013 TaxID=3365679 RepID=UPI0037CE7F51